MTRKIDLPEIPFEITMTGCSSHAEGIGRYDNKVIFVEGGLPGERCMVKVFHRSRKMARANLVEVLDPSPDRVEPPCPYYKECGGCQLQHMGYDRQKSLKQQSVQDAMRHVGNLDVEVLPVIEADTIYEYRNKMTFPLTVKDGKIRFGLHRRNSYRDIVDLEDCFLIEPGMRDCLKKAMQVLNEVLPASSVYCYSNRDGNLRYLSIRSFAGKVVLLLVMREYLEAEANLLGNRWVNECGASGVAFYESPDVNEYDWGMRPAKLMVGETTWPIPYGDIIGTAGPLTFLQTNSAMTRKLYDYVLSIPVQNKECLFDGYCGIGLFSLALAKEYQHIIGVEIDPNAIATANASAAQHGFDNCHFLAGPVEHVLRIYGNPLVTNPKPLKPEVEHLKEDALSRLGSRKITTVILDPPRAGCHPKVIKRLGEIQPLDIIYVSCHAATLARDLGGLVSLGYKIQSVQPFDQFPQTFHVETVVHLRR